MKKPKGPVIHMEQSLRDEFVRAAASPWRQPMRDLCLKYNPREHYGLFTIVPKGRKRPKECLISVEQLIEEVAKEHPSGWGPPMVTFVRMLCGCFSAAFMTAILALS